MSDCEMQRINKPTIYSLSSILERISCGLSAISLTERAEEQGMGEPHFLGLICALGEIC
jgi:hypothetical protein